MSRRGMARAAAFASLLLLAGAAVAQNSLPLPDLRFGGKVGRTIHDSDAAPFPQPVRAPQGAPSIVLIMLDDVGFAQFSAFGGAVPSPALERLAAEGLRYSRFHTAGICSPTRAALLTGRNPHRAGFGLVAELATGYDGYVGSIPRSTATVAEILRQHGYATAMFGKNHNTPAWEGGPSGPFNHWPTGMGFDYFYGFNGWGTSQWHPALVENTRPVSPSSDPAYNLNADLVDHAIGWLRGVVAVDPDRPYLLYLAPGATHAPHHAPREWIEKFKGQFDLGWDRYREQAFERGRRLGVIPADAELTPRPAIIPAWNSLPPGERQSLARQMEVFAAFGAQTDHEVGRLLDAVRALPGADNTLIVYIVGDNGASAEGGALGELNELAPANGLRDAQPFTPEVLAALGGPRFNNNFANGWAWAMNTPFRYYKQVVSHLGAVRNPLVISWPARIRDRGGLRQQFHFVSDIAPTLLEAAGIEAPAFVNGIAQKSLDGVSMLYSLDDAAAPGRRRMQYFEVFANRAIYADGWFASAPITVDPAQPDRASLDPDKVRWELYHLDADFSQAHNLAAREPARLRALQELWWAQAAANDVLPLDWRAGERLAGAGRPNPAHGRTQFVYAPGLHGLPEAIAPNLRNRSWKISAAGRFDEDAEGMIVTQGGLSGGWALYLREARLVFEYNYGGVRYDQIVSTEPLPVGIDSVSVQFDYDGKAGRDVGLGGAVTLWAGDRRIGEGRLERTLRAVFSVSDGLDVGADYGSPVSDRYPFPFPFKGSLATVTIDLLD